MSGGKTATSSHHGQGMGCLPLSGGLSRGTHIRLDDSPSDIVVRSLHKTVTVHLVWVDIIEKFRDLVL